MTVAFDAVGAGNRVNGAATPANITWSHTATGVNRIVLVSIAVYVSTDTTAYTTFTRTVTYGGQAMASLGGVNNATPPGGQSGWIELFYLFNPPTGAQTCSVTVAKTGLALYVDANSVSYTGVGLIGTLQTVAGNSAGPAISGVVSAAGNRVVNVLEINSSINLYNQTQRYTNGHLFGNQIIGDAPGAASVGFSASGGSAQPWAALAVDLKVPPPSPPPIIRSAAVIQQASIN